MAVKVGAVIVTYNPDLPLLNRLLQALRGQVEHVFIIDNGSVRQRDPRRLEQGGYAETGVTVCLGENRGVAAAQNVGVDLARQRECQYVIFFDQDSEPAPGMVSTLVNVSLRLVAEGVPLASVGPRYLDPRQENPPPFLRIQGMRIVRQLCVEPDSVVEVEYLIASGCLMPLSVLDKVGGMREDFFIDYVDIEWGLRAKAAGYRSFGVCDAHMKHDLGDNPIALLGKKYPLHSPLRHYYHFRNAVCLYQQSWLPLNWKLADGWRLVLKYGFYSVFAKPRHEHALMMTRGLWHGLVGRMGRLN